MGSGNDFTDGSSRGMLERQDDKAQRIEGSWKGVLKAGPQILTMMFSFEEKTQKATMGVLEQGVFDLPVTVKLLTRDSVSVAVPQLGASYTARLRDGRLEGVFQQRGLSLPLNLEPGSVRLSRPQEPVAPLPYESTDISFIGGAEGVRIAGTLAYPIGHKAGEQVPVVLMVTGSGPQNRDEELYGHKPFAVLADWLARNGVASLRYDDRGVGDSTGDFNTATTSDLAADAKAGLAYLKGLGQFSHVGVLGHSEGGGIAFMLGCDNAPDFIISLAGPAGRIDELMQAQLNGLARVQGAPQDIVHSAQEAAAYLLQADPRPWTKEFVTLDFTPYVSGTKCPVLALGGENDLNVPPSVNNIPLEAGLAHNPKATIKVYPGLNHLFQHAPKGTTALATSIDETISEEVLRDITAWIQSL